MLTVLFASIGGIVMFLVAAFPMLRSHARFSVFIAFFSLILIAVIFEKILQKKKIWAQIFLSLVFILAFFDQVGKVSALTINPPEIKKDFEDDKDFVQKIEQILPEGAMIFQMPLITFPESNNYDLMRGYLHSKNLRWSYPAMRGRKAALWQQEVVKLDFKDFISELRKAGFKGIYINRVAALKYQKDEDMPKIWREIRKLETNLRTIKKNRPIVSKNLQLIFYEI